MNAYCWYCHNGRRLLNREECHHCGRVKVRRRISTVRDRQAEFCTAWWSHAVGQGPAPTARAFGLSPQLADVLSRACESVWKQEAR